MDIDRTKAAVAGRVARRREPDAADLPRLALRQQLQRVRPLLAGHPPGRGPVPHRVEDINLLQVRNKQGQMVPLGTLVDVREIGGPVFVTRYNLSTAAPITGNLPPGTSSGDAIAEHRRAGRARRCRAR